MLPPQAVVTGLFLANALLPHPQVWALFVLQALASGKASPEELAEIRKLIDKQRGGRR